MGTPPDHIDRLKINGFQTSTRPLEEGDAAVVIRKDGTVQALIHSASEDGREASADWKDLAIIYGIMILMAQRGLMVAARDEALQKVDEAMKLRIVN